MRFAIAKSQRNILIIAAIAAFSIAVFFVFIYIPKKAAMAGLKQELKTVEASINNIKAIVGDIKDLGKGILRLRDEAAALESKFIDPDNTGEFVSMLSEEARQSDSEVVSIQPSEFKRCSGKSGQAFSLANSDCYKITIEIQATGTYKALLNYVKILEAREAPQLVVKNIAISRHQPGPPGNPQGLQAPRLKANITIDAFALLPKK